MDSRLRGNDIGITRHISVIPAKAGIHADTAWKFKESIYTPYDQTQRVILMTE